MARTVNPLRHEARRLQIIDAGITCFAAHGYDGATTALICRTAGIGSGTFFHYFPTKQGLLLGILELGTAESRAWFEGRSEDEDPVAVLDAYVAQAVEDYADPRIAGFIRAVGAVMMQPDVAAALAEDERVRAEGLLPWVARAQERGRIRADLPPERLLEWIVLIVDGFAVRITESEGFDARLEAEVLPDAVRRLLAREPG